MHNRTLKIDLADIIKSIEKMTDADLQNTLKIKIDKEKLNPINVFMMDLFLSGPENNLPGIGKSFAELEQNVNDGTICKIIRLWLSITISKVDSGEIQQRINDEVNKVLKIVEAVNKTNKPDGPNVNNLDDAKSDTNKSDKLEPNANRPNTNKNKNKDRRDNNDDDNPNKRRK